MKIRVQPLSEACLPLLIEPADGRPSASVLSDWLRAEACLIQEHLDPCGAVLFRGFEVSTPSDFEHVGRAFASILSAQVLNYVGGISPRTNLGGEVYTATDLPSRFRIIPHCEMSYMRQSPSHLLFFCHTPPTRGGETPIVDVRKVHRELPADLRDKFASKGVRVRYRLRRKASFFCRTPWPAMFQTHDKGRVEDACARLGWHHAWEANDVLVLTSDRPATQPHPKTGVPVWFNHAAAFHPACHDTVLREDGLHLERLALRSFRRRLAESSCYADGSDIPAQEILPILRVLQKHQVQFPWQRGDLLLLDNYAVAHGRMPFRGPRKVLAMLLDVRSTEEVRS